MLDFSIKLKAATTKFSQYDNDCTQSCGVLCLLQTVSDAGESHDVQKDDAATSDSSN